MNVPPVRGFRCPPSGTARRRRFRGGPRFAIVLDANVLSALIRTHLEAVVVKWLGRQPADSVWLTRSRCSNRELTLDEMAAVLASIGLFCLMSYSVARRTTEIGIRMALGARRGTVIGMVVSESMLLVGIGVALGLGAAIWGGRFVTTVVYGLSATDGLTMTSAVAIIAAVSALAGYLPARRASNVDPMEALRQQ